MRSDYVRAVPQKKQPLKTGAWYEFQEMPMHKVSGRKNQKKPFKCKVLAQYRHFYLLENKNGVKTSLTVNDLASNWKAVGL